VTGPGELAGGLALAALAAACYDGAVVLQAVEARAVGDAAPGAGGLRALARRPRWLGATALAVAGWPFQVAALALAPLTLVQPTLALGLVLVLVLGSRLLREPVGTRGLAAALTIAAGVGTLAWAAPEPSHVHAGTATIAAVIAALTLAAGAPWLARGRLPGDWLILAAGCAYAATGVLAKLLVDALAAGDALTALGLAALTGALAAVGLGDEMSALQRVAAARVAAGAFTVQVVAPVLLAPLLAGEHWGATPLGGGAILLGLAAVVAGTLALEAEPAVSGLAAPRPAR
jgi:drug/metabolite transporter (DMT)-like permease